MSTYQEKHKKYRAKNQEKLKAYQLAYYAAHREKLINYQKDYYKKNLQNIIPREIRTESQKRLARILSSAKSRAHRDGIDFRLKVYDLYIPPVCPLLGVPFSNLQKDYSYSIDRIDNSQGYVKENVWIISYKANRMKNDASPAEWKLFCKNSLKKLEELKY